ncbi:MAG: hypothetical protein ACFFAJ_04065 [Candidatus Hodarchaeota archaeon]
MKKESLTELISLDKQKTFIEAFINYWEIVKSHINFKKRKLNWQKWPQIAKNLLYSITKPFYDNWVHTGMLSWNEAYIREFSSITLQYRGDLVLIPKQLIYYESCKPENTLLLSLKNNQTKINLERILVLLFEDTNLRLRKTDFNLLKNLAQPRFSRSLDRFPKNKELAARLHCDIRTISRSYSYLFQHQMLSLIYLVDLARIGYQTILIHHNQDHRHIPDSVKPYIESNIPTSTEEDFVAILKFPYRNTQIYLELMEHLDSDRKILLKTQYRGWNLAGLTQNPTDRWKLKPPLMEDAESWNKNLIVGETGVEFNLDPSFDNYVLSNRESHLLALVHKHSTMTEEYLSKQLKISRSYILEDWKNLLRNKLIFRFPIFRNIGLGSQIYFCLSGFESLQRELTNIIDHLRFFPYSNMMYNLKSGILVGRMNLPPSWLNDFIYQLASLPDFYPNCSYFYYIGPKAYWPWGFDILNTFDQNSLDRD